MLSKTSSDVLDLADADENTITLAARQARPYPPADVKVDGVLAYNIVGEHNEPVFTWAHRDRKLQADSLLDHQEASVGPEDGTTYTIRIYHFVTDALLNTYDGIAGDTWTYDAAMQALDAATGTVRVELESERDGLASYQKYSFTVILQSGYGYGYGLNYGGA